MTTSIRTLTFSLKETAFEGFKTRLLTPPVSQLDEIQRTSLLKIANTIVGLAVPFASRNHFKILDVRKGYVKAGIKLKGNTNHLGTMYAGALFTVGEIPGGVLTFLNFDLSYSPIIKDLQLQFVAPAKSNVTVEFRLSDTDIARITREVETLGKSEFELEGQLKDKHGHLVAKSKGLYQLRRPKE